MRATKWLAMAWRDLARTSSVDADAGDEMRFHVDMEMEKHLRAGIAPDEARRLALLSFGGVVRHTEAMRDDRVGHGVGRLAHDARFALRQLRKTPGFTIAAVVTLAIGIGGNATVFSVVNGVLLRPLPYPDADRLVTIAHTTKGGNLPPRIPGSSATHVVYADARRSFAAIALYETIKVNLEGDVPERAKAVLATSSLFNVLRVSPALGRFFTNAEDQPGAPPVAMISHGLWTRRFGGDRSVIGKVLAVDGVAHLIVGVMPASFAFPDDKVQLWLPMQVDVHDLGGFHTPSIGRLIPGVTPLDAQRELLALLPRVSAVVDFLTPAMLDGAGIRPEVHPFADDVIGGVRPILWMMWAMVGLVLLIACVNVASLLVVRAEARHGEMMLRRALGAERRHLLAQSLTESTVLIVLGTALGVGLAHIALSMLRRLASDVLPRVGDVRADTTVFVLTAAVAGAAAMLFSLIPMARGRRSGSSLVLAGGQRSATSDRGARRLRHVLVVSQVAMATVLLVASGLMVRSVQKLSQVDIGFIPDGVLTFRVALPSAEYPTAERVARFHGALLARIRALPDVRAVGATTDLPLTGANAYADPLRADRAAPSAKTIPRLAEMRVATPGYFEAMGIPLRRGRALRETDTDQRSGAVVVSDAVVRTIVTEGDPIGARVAHGLAGVRGERPWSDVVGVVGDVRVSLEEPPMGAVYYAMANRPGVEMDWLARSMVYAVRVRATPAALVPAIGALLHDLDPRIPLAEVRTLRSIVDAASATKYFVMVGLVVAAMAGLFLGAIGLYGVLSLITAQRTREIGVRIALGATPGALRFGILRHGIALCGLGLGIGLFAAAALGALIRPLLFQVSATDPLTLAIVSVVLLAVGTMATWIPASRAAHLDPVRALRAE